MDKNTILHNNGLQLNKMIYILGVISIIYSAWIILGGNLNVAYMIWNLFLAWIPLMIIIVIMLIKRRRSKNILLKFMEILLWILWLLFYPNSPYIITDFIHINPKEFIIQNPNYIQYSDQHRIIFNSDLKIWIHFMNICVGVWLGYTSGFLSLYLGQKIVGEKNNKAIGWIFVLIVNVLSGFAIYLGRFDRWNSWDIIIEPENIISIAVSSFNITAVQFTMLFAIAYFILYIINFVLIKSVKG